MRHVLKFVVPAVVATSGVVGTATAEPPRYRLSAIDGLVIPQQSDVRMRNRIVGINNTGVAIGSRIVGESPEVVFRVEDGVITDLPLLPGYGRALAHDINSAGIIIGEATDTEWGIGVPVLWSGGEVQELPCREEWGTHLATSINDAGVIVGTALQSGGIARAWVLEAGELIELPAPEGGFPPISYVRAVGLNNAGVIVGSATPFNFNEPWLPLRWRDGVVEVLPIPPGAEHLVATRVNDSGAILGLDYDLAGLESRSFVWTDSGVTELQPLPSDLPNMEAFALNNAGQVVGSASAGAGVTAFLWQGGVTYDLRALLWNADGVEELRYALDINDQGVIVAIALLGGEWRSVLLTPVVCPADWSGDGGVNSGDISAYLTAWISSVNTGGLGADVNGDLAINSADISAFLTLWLAAVAEGC